MELNASYSFAGFHSSVRSPKEREEKGKQGFRPKKQLIALPVSGDM